MLESVVEAHFVKHVKAARGLQRKVRYIGRRGAVDRVAIFPINRVYWVELKRPGGSAREEQEREHDRLRHMGCDVRVLDTKEAIDSFLFEVVGYRRDTADAPCPATCPYQRQGSWSDDCPDCRH